MEELPPAEEVSTPFPESIHGIGGLVGRMQGKETPGASKDVKLEVLLTTLCYMLKRVRIIHYIVFSYKHRYCGNGMILLLLISCTCFNRCT